MSGLLSAVLLAALMAGCATPPSTTQLPSTAVFYPPLPNPPRIQHLASFLGERDLTAASTSDLAQFVLGDDQTARRLMQPYGVAVFDGRLYVADSKMPGLAVFDLAKRQFSVVTGTGNGRMRKPINVTIDSDGTKYVTDTARNQILVYDRNNGFRRALGAQGEFRPVDTAIAGDRLYVVDVRHHQVHVLDKNTGKPLFRFGKAGSGAGELFHPTNIAIGADGDVYVSDTTNFRVQRFTAEGKPVRSYGEVGIGFGRFARPKGIALDRAGRIYVGDAAFENVQVFDNGGRLLMFFGQPGEKAEGLNLPAGVAIDYDNVKLFQSYADPRFHVEYLVLVVSQFGVNKVDVFGFGRMEGMDYPPDAPAAAEPAR